MHTSKIFIELPNATGSKNSLIFQDKKRELIKSQRIAKKDIGKNTVLKNKANIDFQGQTYKHSKYFLKGIIYISIFIASFLLMLPFLISVRSTIWEKREPVQVADDILYTQFLINGIENPKIIIKKGKIENYYLPQFRLIKYKVKRGDSLFGIAQKFNTTIDAIITANRLKNAYYLAINRRLYVPNIPGIFYTVKRGDNLSKIANKYHISINKIADINDLSSPIIKKGQKIFIPNASLSNWERAIALGNIFKTPTRGRLTSRMGFRIDPFTGKIAYHPGIDIANRIGTPIYAAQLGRVIFTGYRGGYGKTIILAHPKGYVTLYGHLSRILVRRGQIVRQGQLIGKMGSTGRSTGPHLHFEIHQNGKLVNPLEMIKIYR